MTRARKEHILTQCGHAQPESKRKCMSEADTTPICDRRKSADMAMTSQGPRPRPGAPGALVLQACELHYSSAIHSAEAKREACNYPCTRCGLRLSAAKKRHGKINLQSVPDAGFLFVDSRQVSMLDSCQSHSQDALGYELPKPTHKTCLGALFAGTSRRSSC